MTLKNFPTFIKNHPYLTGAVFLIVLAVLAYLIFANQDNSSEVKNQSDQPKVVSTITVSEFGNDVIGVVAPSADRNSFVIRAEAGGKITAVAQPGAVKKGTVIARVENSSQQAALIQAQGTYDAALAGAKQSSFSVETSGESLTDTYAGANNTLRATLVSTQGLMENTVETFFSGSNIALYNLSDKIWDKKIIDYDLAKWSDKVKTTIPDGEVKPTLNQAIDTTSKTSTLLDAIYQKVLEVEKNASGDYLTAVTKHKQNLITARSAVASNLATLRTTELNIQKAESSLTRSQSTSFGGETSAASANIKQALGVLRAAEATYNKTIIKAPFDGQINTFNVAVGDIINSGNDIAIIVPDNDVEVDLSFQLPLTAVKYTPTGAYVLTTTDQGTLQAITVETGLVNANTISVTGLSGNEQIVLDVRGLNDGDKYILN